MGLNTGPCPFRWLVGPCRCVVLHRSVAAWCAMRISSMRMVMPTMDAKRHVLCYYRQPFDVEIFLGNLSVKISKMNLYIKFRYFVANLDISTGNLWQKCIKLIISCNLTSGATFSVSLDTRSVWTISSIHDQLVFGFMCNRQWIDYGPVWFWAQEKHTPDFNVSIDASID